MARTDRPRCRRGDVRNSEGQLTRRKGPWGLPTVTEFDPELLTGDASPWCKDALLDCVARAWRVDVERFRSRCRADANI